ncbi:MAG TPA: endonuclease/exonuclease/phosphatase family protein [Burkholderiales bacterium]|nr:endonuclease/exonuclease/phosphatase family protein [Burkholderiales bacterium]
MSWLVAAGLLVGTLMIIATALPLLRKGAWWIRMFDFPRLQITIVSAGTLALLLAAADHSSAWQNFCIALLALALVYQTYMMFPYTVLARRQVQDAHAAGDETTIAVLFANVLMTNRDSQRLLALIREEEPDLVLAVEADAWWQGELDALARTYRYAVRQPQDNTYGMLLYSRLELVEPQVKFLVQADVPSIHARVKLRSGALVELRCVHPRPPAPQEAKDAAPRDAELIVVGRELKEKRKRGPTIVLGDLNDVAWSRTNYQFQELSGLLDPRIGRGFYHTFHARYPFLRYPLDHCFHSKHFRLVSFKRLRKFGSDHFPVGIKLSFEPDAAATQEEPRDTPRAAT